MVAVGWQAHHFLINHSFLWIRRANEALSLSRAVRLGAAVEWISPCLNLSHSSLNKPQIFGDYLVLHSSAPDRARVHPKLGKYPGC